MPSVTDTRGTERLKYLVADMGLSVEGSSQKALASLALANSISAYFPTISLKIVGP